MQSITQKAKSDTLQTLDHKTIGAIAGGRGGYLGVEDWDLMMSYETRNYSSMWWSSWNINQCLP